MKFVLIFLLVCASLSLGLPSVLNLDQTARAKSAPAAKSPRKISADIIERVKKGRGTDRVRVIVQPKNAPDSSLDSAVESLGGRDIKRFRNFPIRVLTLPAHAAAVLAARHDVAYVSVDREIRTFGHLSHTTGADQIRSSTTSGSLDGTGIGIAVLDSGIDTTHKAFLDKSNNIRVLYSEDFTGEGRTDDPYGHGTHVASLAAGNGRISNSQYVG
ncbi:MAG: S8 family serine peptidase, partial [Pyrinomonadaceae bacterium]